MNFFFLVDRYEQWHIDKDTSFAMMFGAQEAGHNVYRFYTGDTSIEDGRVIIQAERVSLQKDPNKPFIVEETSFLNEKDIDIVFIRTDPPFDETYLMQTWLLDRLPKSIPVINKPSGIRSCNEKIWATQFPELLPPTLVSSKKEVLEVFINKYQECIIKPTDGFGGRGIQKVHKDTAESVLSEMTFQFNKEVIVQKYIPEAEIGDKRILLLDGEPLGAVLRVHGAEDFRNNFMAGGKPEKTEITENDRKIIAKLKPFLQEQGLYFVGIDILGEYLTEVNVTSPTCLQEINELEGLTLEADVIRFAENLIEKLTKQSRI